MKVATAALVLAALGSSIVGSELALRGTASLSSRAVASARATTIPTNMAKPFRLAQYCVPSEEDYDEGKIFCRSSS
jgi:hypothetical protein